MKGVMAGVNAAPRSGRCYSNPEGMSKKRPSFLSTLTWVDWLLTVLAVSAIGYGLLRAKDLDPERWSFIAGPLFALSSGFLFVLALRVQLREHRQAIDEMEQANVNHSELARIAKQEKEFNVCLAAIEEVRSHLSGLRYGPYHGLGALHEITRVWRNHLSEANLNNGGWTHSQLKGPSYPIDAILPQTEAIISLRVKLYWILDSAMPTSPHRKDLDERDARFIRALIIPMIKDVSAAIDVGVLGCYEFLGNLLARENANRLEAMGLDRTGLAMCMERVERVLEVASNRGYQPTIVI